LRELIDRKRSPVHRRISSIQFLAAIAPLAQLEAIADQTADFRMA
jgi:hypothetical protein